MKVLVCALPQLTHFYATVPLAWALRTAGHEVRYATSPGFAEAVTDAGLTAVPVGPLDAEDDEEIAEEAPAGLPAPYDLAETPADWTDGHAEAFDAMVTYAFGEFNAPILDDVVAFARSWQPDLVLWEPFTYAGAFAAAACGAAHGRVLFGTDFLGVTHEWIHTHVPDDRLTAWLRTTAASLGIPYTDDLRSGHFTVDQLPSPLRLASPELEYVPARYVAYGGPAEVPAWLRETPSRPRIALTLGTSATLEYGGYSVQVPDLLAALSTMDVEVVATVDGPVPDNVRAVPYVPLDALAPTCAAAIHHGGFGTMLTFARHGVPQLTLPHDFDAPLLGRKLAARGAGLTVTPAQASGRRIRWSVEQLLRNDGIQAAAAGLAGEIAAMPSPNAVVARLEELTTKHRGGRP
ncbi:nucleotide disphospho-sugar-binding domain-containing protein [Amycolatopsis sp. NPDC049252]|uniref:nucleotide disphospho-sugar-binding domain-containing protein n=1 Tax=Amycolatopsis sp. NPDC049252 TaxID=3363933 RepID=UPI00371A2910